MSDPVAKPSSQDPTLDHAKGHVVGRTPWDFATEAIRSPTAILLVVTVFLVVPLAVHHFAEPGSEINLFLGLIKYKKATAPPEKVEAKQEPKTEIAKELIPANYILPEKVEQTTDTTVPILDGTINITVWGILQKEQGLILGGANFPLVRAAARTLNGNLLPVSAESGRGLIVSGEREGILQIEYSTNLFEIIVRSTGLNSYALTVKPIEKATLELKAIGQR